MFGETQAQLFLHDGQQHGHPLLIESGSRAAGVWYLGSDQKTLDLEDDGSASFDGYGHRRPGSVGLPVAEHAPGGIVDGDQTGSCHFEHTQLSGCTKTVLERSQDS